MSYDNTTTKRTEGDALCGAFFSCCILLFRYMISFIRPNLVVTVAGSKKGGYFPEWFNMH